MITGRKTVTAMTGTTSSTTGKWVWRPRWCRETTARSSGRSSAFPLIAVALLQLSLLTFTVKDVQGLGFFELQILEIENYRGQLATGECCGSGGSSSFVQQQQQSSSSARFTTPPVLQCMGAPQCNTLFQVCLREYQSQAAVSATASGRMNGGDDDSMATGSNHHHPNSHLHHCSFGNVTSPVLGGNSFTLGGDAVAAMDPSTTSDSANRTAPGGNLALPFSFSWTRSFTFILQAMDYNNYTGDLSVIEEATYSGILLPGNEWKALSHLGRTARMAYRVRVRCDRNYYGQTCTKLCKPRDDRFGHYTCGDTDGRKECIPGWQGETCDKAVCKTGCHPVHGKCDYPGGCECRKGWQGELCDQCMTYPGCKHGYCNGTSWQCICDINWGGILCDQDLNYCGTHEPCLNGGTCKSTAPDRYTCTCPEGFGGSNCDVVLNPCATDPCANGGKCRTVDAVGGANGATSGGAFVSGSAAQQPMLVPKQFHCDCQPGWTGSTCNTEIDECATQPPRCLNGGTCVDLVADWRCACSDDRWRGRRCEIDVDECERQHRERRTEADQQCGPNAVSCRPTGPATATECVCRRGWTTAAATVALKENGTLTTATLGCTVNVDDCAGPEVKCANGGTCLDLIGGYTCACPPGYTGRNCRTQIDPCGGDSESGTIGDSNPCKNGGECVPARRWRNGGNGPTMSKQQQAYSCICPLGYSGENCEIDRDHCTPNPCRNDGLCLNTPEDYYCQCSGDSWSWHGKNCTLPRDAVAAAIAAAAAATKTTVAVPTTVSTTTTATTTTTTTTTVASTRPPPSPQPRTTTTTPAAAIRRPGTTDAETAVWRSKQHRGDEDDNGKTVAVTIIEQVDDGGVAMCNGGHRHINYWPSDDGCNECKCTKPSASDDKAAGSPLVTCTNLWCGPASYDCLSGVFPCTGTNQICMPIVDDVDDEELLDEELDKREDAASVISSLLLWRQCLRPPCGGSAVDTDRDRDDVRLRYGYDDDDDNAYVAVGPWPRRRRRGQCVTSVADSDDDEDAGPSTTVWPSAVRHCVPNGTLGDKHSSHRHRHGDACGRLRVTLDPTRLRRGTRVSAVCHSLRRLLARSWVREENDGLDRTEANNRRNRVYVMCEVAENQRNDNESSGSRRRRRRRVTVRVSVAVVMDKQRRTLGTTVDDDVDDDEAETIVESAVQTLYRRLNGGVTGSTAASTKKVPAIGHRVRTGSNNGDDYDDTAALAFLTAAVVDVIVGGNDGGSAVAETPSSPAPANSSGPPANGWQNYYYWTGGVACGALVTVLVAMAFLLVRFRSNSRRKVGGNQVGSGISESAVIGGGDGGGGVGGDGLMLSLVHRQNEENLKRLVTGGGNRNSGTGSDYGGGCGRNNLMAGSSLSCSRVSIVHPLCNATAADGDCSPEMHRKSMDGGVGPSLDDDSKGGEKKNVAVPPVAAVRSVAVAVAVPRQQQQQRPSAAAAPMLLCKKTLNVDNDQQQRRQLQQQHQILLLQKQQQQQLQPMHQQQQQQLQPMHQQQQQQLQPMHQQQQQQQIAAQQQYNRRSRGPPSHQQQQHYLQQHHGQQQQHYAQPPINNEINNDSDDETAPAPSLTVLV